MALKKCKVTQLDDTFWRVDWDGDARLRGLVMRMPAIVENIGGAWRVFDSHAGKIVFTFPTLNDLLGDMGLTRHKPEPDTAEERIRHGAGMVYHDADLVRHWADVRAVLAELDRLRAENADGSFSKGWEKGYAAALDETKNLANIIDENRGIFT